MAWNTSSHPGFEGSSEKGLKYLGLGCAMSKRRVAKACIFKNLYYKPFKPDLQRWPGS